MTVSLSSVNLVTRVIKVRLRTTKPVLKVSIYLCSGQYNGIPTILTILPRQFLLLLRA